MTRKQDSPETPAEAARRHGMALTHLLIVSDIERSVRFYRDVLGATVVRRGAPSILRLGQGWLILNVGGGPTPDKPDVTMTPPDGSANVTSALNIRVADLAAVYRAWSDRAPGSSPNRWTSAGRSAAISAILTAISSKWGRPPPPYPGLQASQSR